MKTSGWLSIRLKNRYSNVIARVKIHEDYPEDKVKVSVKEKLLAGFNFTSRDFWAKRDAK
jgi:hypothetical protein